MRHARHLIGLGLAATIAVTASWIVTSGPRDDNNTANGRLLPDLSTRLDDLTQIRIQQGGGTYHLNKVDTAWQLPEFDGFPSDPALTRKMLGSLARMEIAARKTDDPARHGKLQLKDPSQAEAASTGVTLYAGDDIAADLVFGKITRPAEGGKSARLYLRKKAENQTWQIDASATLPDSAMAWLDLSAAKLDRNRIKLARLTHPGGEVITVNRPSADQSDFAVADIPDGFKAKTDYIANSLGSAMAWPSLGAPSKPPASYETVAQGYFETFDGLVVETEAIKTDKGYQGLMLKAILLPHADDTAKSQAGTLNNLATGWAFKLDDSKFSDFTRKPSYFLEAISSEAAQESE